MEAKLFDIIKGSMFSNDTVDIKITKLDIGAGHHSVVIVINGQEHGASVIEGEPSLEQVMLQAVIDLAGIRQMFVPK